MYRRILLPLHGSKLAERAIPFALEAARQHNAELCLLRVVEPLAKSHRIGATAVATIEAAEAELVKLARSYVEQTAKELQSKGAANVQTETRTGLAAREIIEAIRESETDLVVMSKRGASGLSRWLLGSVTDHVVRGAEVPVLVVPGQLKDAA